MSIQWRVNPRELSLIQELEQEKTIQTSEELIISVTRKQGALTMSLCEGGVNITYERNNELARAYALLSQLLAEKKDIREERRFESLTLMLDCSRNGVVNIKTAKKLIRQLALLGFSKLQLYTEDTYEMDGEPFFGYMRGRFSKKELKELDAYGRKLGVELVPCIQTLAHLNAIFRWERFQKIRDIGDILLCGEEETYVLIEKMIASCAECFSSREINIGMDEAEMLGRGRYLKYHKYEEIFPIMMRHLRRVLEICRKYGFHPMMWSDMFFKPLSGGGYQADGVCVDQSVRDQIPGDVSLVYWDYYARNQEKYDLMLSKHKELAEEIRFAGGAWVWNGFAPLMAHSILCNSFALPSCAENGVRDVIVTAWGDNGAECGVMAILPALTQYAEYCYEQDASKEATEKRLKNVFGLELSDMLLLDEPNLTPDNPAPGRVSVGPAKYLLYQDVLQGLYDRHVDADTYPEHFAKTAESLAKAAERGGEYRYLFDVMSALCKVLTKKSRIGILLKNAYDRKDCEALALCVKDCEEILELLESFYEKFRTQWYLERKPFGFDVQDLRIGGLKRRIESAIRTVNAYLDGSIDRIEELEVERLVLDERSNAPYKTLPLYHNSWSNMATVSVIG